MVAPLAILSVPTVLIGLLLGLPPEGGLIHGWLQGVFAHAEEAGIQPGSIAAAGHHGFELLGIGGLLLLAGATAGMLGILLAHRWYVRSPEMPARFVARIPFGLGPGMYRASLNKYYVDDIYQLVFARGGVLVSEMLWWFDAKIIDGAVNGAGWLASRAGGERHVIRLMVPEDGVIAIDDLVYGRVEWPLRSIEDQILLKSDGFPTYQLAVVIDDHLMEISHVFRGEDWLPSTPKHLLVYQAFGWTVPPHAHLPNVLGPDSKKLAKRHGATKVEEFRTTGYLPEAMRNYLSLIGWSPGTEEEIFSLAELVDRWRIEQVHRAGGRWDRERLNWFNGTWIRRLGADELAARLEPFLPAGWDRATVRAVVPLIQERMATLAEAPELIAFLFTDTLDLDPALLVPKKRETLDTVTALSRTTVALRYLDPFTPSAIEAALGAVAADVGWSLRDVTIAARAAVTGRKVGPPLYESIALLGRPRTVERLEAAQELLEP